MVSKYGREHVFFLSCSYDNDITVLCTVRGDCVSRIRIGKTPKARGGKRTMATPRYRGQVVAAAVARDAWDALKISSIYSTLYGGGELLKVRSSSGCDRDRDL